MAKNLNPVEKLSKRVADGRVEDNQASLVNGAPEGVLQTRSHGGPGIHGTIAAG